MNNDNTLDIYIKPTDELYDGTDWKVLEIKNNNSKKKYEYDVFRLSGAIDLHLDVNKDGVIHLWSNSIYCDDKYELYMESSLSSLVEFNHDLYLQRRIDNQTKELNRLLRQKQKLKDELEIYHSKEKQARFKYVEEISHTIDSLLIENKALNNLVQALLRKLDKNMSVNEFAQLVEKERLLGKEWYTIPYMFVIQIWTKNATKHFATSMVGNVGTQNTSYMLYTKTTPSLNVCWVMGECIGKKKWGITNENT